MRIEPLGAGVTVCVTDSHHFTTDTILLADFAQPKKHERAMDMGTGCGTIPLLWARDDVPKEVVAVDIQPDAVELLVRSLDVNRAGGHTTAHITPLLADIRQLDERYDAGSFDLVVCNPPYTRYGAGIESPDPSHRIIRHETCCTLDDICRVSAHLLRFGGRLCVCQRPERLTDVLDSMRRHGIEPKRLRLVQGKCDKPPKLVLIEGKRGARVGFLEVMPTLIVENPDGSFTDGMIQIYRTYQEDRYHE